MTKYKYMEAIDSFGEVVKRGDKVAVFAPDEKGQRRMFRGIVRGINAKSISVAYLCNGKMYPATVPNRYWLAIETNYQELLANYKTLEEDYDNLVASIAILRAELAERREDA